MILSVFCANTTLPIDNESIYFEFRGNLEISLQVLGRFGSVTMSETDGVVG